MILRILSFDCSQLKIICILKSHILSHTQNPVMNNPSYSMKNLLVFFFFLSFFVTIQFQKKKWVVQVIGSSFSVPAVKW